MPRTQLGLRLSEPEAIALRAAARERRMTLGELVTTLLRESRADAGAGIWLDLDEATMQALRAVAGAAGGTPERVLQALVGTWLDSELAYLLERLDDELGRGPSKLRELLRSRDEEETEEPEEPLADDEDEPASVEFTVSTD
jgi:hypothetical protein